MCLYSNVSLFPYFSKSVCQLSDASNKSWFPMVALRLVDITFPSSWTREKAVLHKFCHPAYSFLISHELCSKGIGNDTLGNSSINNFYCLRMALSWHFYQKNKNKKQTNIKTHKTNQNKLNQVSEQTNKQQTKKKPQKLDVKLEKKIGDLWEKTCKPHVCHDFLPEVFTRAQNRTEKVT